MTNNIVNVNVTQTQAATPSTLQRTGAFISQGATTLAVGSYSLLTSLSDLTPLLKGALAISTITWSGSIATVTTAAPHGFTTSDTILMTIAGTTPAGYSGTYTCTITGASTFTYPLVSNPGSCTVPGTYTPEDVAELTQMATTFFAQGANVSVYVLELGAGNAADGVTALTTFITANPNFFYAYLVPRYWDAAASFIALLTTLQSTTAKTYFFITTTNGTYTQYSNLQKAALTWIEAPGKTNLEFSAAAGFWVELNYNPSSTNKVAPYAFTYVFGVTPYPKFGNNALFSAWKAAGVNWIGTGAEGGVSTAIILWGKMMDLRPLNYWYSVDWVQINVAQALANEIINGSNNPINPLYYNQDGINRLQARAAQVMASAITFGLALGSVVQTQMSAGDFTTALNSGDLAGQAVVNAVPLVPYLTASPNDYKTGTYNGISITYTPLRGFESITVNINVTDFVTG